MSLVSSPVTYPSSSSPPRVLVKRKRQHELGVPFAAKRKALDAKENGSAVGKSPTHAQEDPNIVPLKVPRLDSVPSRLPGPFADGDDDDDNGGIANEGSIFNTFGSGAQAAEKKSVLDFESNLDILDNVSPQHFASQPPKAKTSSGKLFKLQLKKVHTPLRYEQVVAERSTTTPGKAAKSYYGIDVHTLLDETAKSA